MRIDLSESGRFMQVFPARSTNGYCIIQKYEETKGKPRELGGIKIPVGDLTKVCVSLMLSGGIDVKEILAELFAQVNSLDGEQLEYLMRHRR